jgi:predicted HAD superfamily phosphohydrolase
VDIINWKKRTKISLFADYIIIHISNAKYSTRELLQLINTFNKVARYKINSNKSVTLLYSNDNRTEIEIRKITPFTIATNYMKYLEGNLNKASERLG